MQLLTLNNKILQTSFFALLIVGATLTVAAPISDIGSIVEHKGSGGITRQAGDILPTGLDVGLQPMDFIETANGRLKATFSEGSELNMTEHTEATITKYYWDKDKNDGEIGIKFAAGTARFTTGRLGLIPKENILIETQSATIAVRGTDFTTTVDELGRTLVILLPETECTIDGDCSPSGRIIVTNEGGSVTLEEAYQATMVSSISTPPVAPVTLQNINIGMIDNMFIVSPPQEIEEAEDEIQSRSNDSGTSILDFTDLDTNYLDDDFLAEDDLEFTELDMDLLDVDFLQDVLVAIEEVDILKAGTKQAQGGQEFAGTKLGFDKETQYNTFIDKGLGQLVFYRDVNGVIGIRVSRESNTRIESENEGKRNIITVGDGTSVVIIIKQGG
ncbi:FecR family protein [bacterium]|nr:FecR family protein [bacterium]